MVFFFFACIVHVLCAIHLQWFEWPACPSFVPCLTHLSSIGNYRAAGGMALGGFWGSTWGRGAARPPATLVTGHGHGRCQLETRADPPTPPPPPPPPLRGTPVVIDRASVGNGLGMLSLAYMLFPHTRLSLLLYSTATVAGECIFWSLASLCTREA